MAKRKVATRATRSNYSFFVGVFGVIAITKQGLKTHKSELAIFIHPRQLLARQSLLESDL